MTTKHLLPISALLVFSCLSAAVAQRPAPGAKPTPPPSTAAPATSSSAPSSSGSATGIVPITKVAVINSQAFFDSKQGIAKFATTINRLNGEFQKVKDDITNMSQRQTALEGELAKLQQAPPGTPIDSNSVRTKSDQLDQLKKDITRKQEDAQTDYDKRRKELFAPLEEELGRALEAFAKARGITVIFDTSNVPVLYVADAVDITLAFIADFNSKNPAAASATPTRP